METMNLKEYIALHGEDEAADRLGVTVRAIRSWRYGARAPRRKDIPKLIERSGGQLRFSSFFEDCAA